MAVVAKNVITHIPQSLYDFIFILVCKHCCRIFSEQRKLNFHVNCVHGINCDMEIDNCKTDSEHATPSWTIGKKIVIIKTVIL